MIITSVVKYTSAGGKKTMRMPAVASIKTTNTVGNGFLVMKRYTQFFIASLEWPSTKSTIPTTRWQYDGQVLLWFFCGLYARKWCVKNIGVQNASTAFHCRQVCHLMNCRYIRKAVLYVFWQTFCINMFILYRT